MPIFKVFRRPTQSGSVHQYKNWGHLVQRLNYIEDLVSGSIFTCFFSWEYWFDNFSMLKPNFRQETKKCFFAEKRLLRESFKVTLKEIGKEKIFEIFFHRFRFFHLDTFWYDDRYWKVSPGSTLHDSNNGLAISDDLS